MLAGCGGDRPHLARADAAPLIALSRRIASEGRCAQARDIRALHRRTIALVDARRVPSRLQQTLVSGVDQLASQAPVCVPRVVPVAVEPVAPPSPSPRHEHELPKHHGKHHDHGHGDGDGQGD